MNKSILLTAAFAALAIGSATAQDLNTVSIADQFNVGQRGNLGTAGFTTPQDGTIFADYTGVDAFGTIRYINVYTGLDNESPVVNVTTTGASNVDRANPGIVIPANTRPGATDGATAVLVGDDGGHNGLYFGESDDTDYFVEVDVYVWDRSAIAGNELSYLGARIGRDGTGTGGSYNIDRDPGYYIAVNHHNLTVDARSALVTASSANAIVAGVGYTELVTPVAITAGWHTLRIEVSGTNVNFLVDGASIGSITGASVTNGRAGLGHRENGVASADEIASVFDNLKAGQSTVTPTAVSNWSLYDN